VHKFVVAGRHLFCWLRPRAACLGFSDVSSTIAMPGSQYNALRVAS
jgi:hypothetical protein